MSVQSHVQSYLTPISSWKPRSSDNIMITAGQYTHTHTHTQQQKNNDGKSHVAPSWPAHTTQEHDTQRHVPDLRGKRRSRYDHEVKPRKWFGFIETWWRKCYIHVSVINRPHSGNLHMLFYYILYSSHVILQMHMKQTIHFQTFIFILLKHPQVTTTKKIKFWCEPSGLPICPPGHHCVLMILDETLEQRVILSVFSTKMCLQRTTFPPSEQIS